MMRAPITAYNVPARGASGHPWSAQVFSNNGLFRGGKAASVAFGFACGVFDCSVGYAEQTVQLSSRAR